MQLTTGTAPVGVVVGVAVARVSGDQVQRPALTVLAGARQRVAVLSLVTSGAPPYENPAEDQPSRNSAAVILGTPAPGPETVGLQFSD